MKKKIFGGIAILALVVMAAWNVSIGSKTNGITDIMLANVEALATSESVTCPNGCLPNGDGCTCNGWNACEKEAS